MNKLSILILLHFVFGSLFSAPQEQSEEKQEVIHKMTAQNDTFKKLVPFINTYCIKCHNAEKDKGDFRIDNMDQNLVHGKHAQLWHEALQVLNAGEMPPEKKSVKQPPEKELISFIDTLTDELEKAKRARSGQPKMVMRRLTNKQYNNTLKDLLGIDNNYAKDLPKDGVSTEGFKNNSEVLDMSTLQMEYYLNNARKALDKTVVTEKPEVYQYKIEFGESISPELNRTIPLGQVSEVLTNKHYKLSATTPKRNFDFIHRKLKDKYEFRDKTLEGIYYSVYPDILRLSKNKRKVAKQGLVLEPRGDHDFGKGGQGHQQGPMEHMRLAIREFPLEGPVTIRVKASKAPNALFAPYPNQTTLKQHHVSVSEFKEKPIYNKSQNMEKPEFIIQTFLSAEDEGIYHVDAHFETEQRAKMNIHVGKTRFEGVTLQSKKDQMILPIARVKLTGEKTELKFTSKKALNIKNLVLSKVPSDHYLNKQFAKRKVNAERPSNIAVNAVFKTEKGTYETILAGNQADMHSIPKARAIKEGEYHIPQPISYHYNETFTISEDGLYQVDFNLSEDPRSLVTIMINDMDLKNFKFNYKKDIKNYSAGLIKLKKGNHKLKLSSKRPLNQHMVSLSLNNQPEAKLAFQKHYDSQYGYLNAFMGSRRDDGQEYKVFPKTVKVDAPIDAPQIIEFTDRIENYPLPIIEVNNTNPLANLALIGLWNTPWNKERKGNILIHSIEFETNVTDQWPPQHHKNIFVQRPKGDEANYAKTILSNFLPKAFRRPLTPTESELYFSFYKQLRPSHESFEETIKEVLAISLSSPQFLYISEPEGSQSKALSEYELASRLSYFLWNSMPNETLLSAAKNKQLRSNLEQHIKRMLSDEKSHRFTKTFTNDWLTIDKLGKVIVSSKYAKGYNLDIKNNFKDETYAFIHHLLENNGSIKDIIDSNYAMLNWRLAEFYGVNNVDGLEFKPVAVKKENNRGGILTNGSILTAMSTGDHSSPIKRGVWLARKIVDSPPPKPPADVPPLDEENPELAKLTRKEQLALHREHASCNSCHMKIDPWGIPFEEYGPSGRIKSSHENFAKDTIFPDGSKVDGLKQLKDYILTQKFELVNRSFIKHLSSYAIGRSLSFTDDDEINKIMTESASKQYKLHSIIHSIINSNLFQRL